MYLVNQKIWFRETFYGTIHIIVVVQLLTAGSISLKLVQFCFKLLKLLTPFLFSKINELRLIHPKTPQKEQSLLDFLEQEMNYTNEIQNNEAEKSKI